jgi:hypothetical protein
MELVFDCVELAVRVLVRAGDAVLGAVRDVQGEDDIVLEAAVVRVPHPDTVEVLEELGEEL